MATLTVLYRTPADRTAFDAYYFGTHVPIAKRIPGLVRYDVSDGAIASPAGSAPYHLVATLEFASMDELRAALASPAGRDAAADVAHFGQAGVEMLIFETRTV